MTAATRQIIQATLETMVIIGCVNGVLGIPAFTIAVIVGGITLMVIFRVAGHHIYNQITESRT
jgi:hypothetical protein